MFLWMVVTLATLPNWMLDGQSWMNRLQRSVSAFLWTVNMELDQCFLFHFFHMKKLAKFNTNKIRKISWISCHKKNTNFQKFPLFVPKEPNFLQKKKKTLGWTHNRQTPRPKLRCSLPNLLMGHLYGLFHDPTSHWLHGNSIPKIGCHYFRPGLIVLPKNTLPYWLPIQTLSFSLSLSLFSKKWIV